MCTQETRKGDEQQKMFATLSLLDIYCCAKARTVWPKNLQKVSPIFSFVFTIFTTFLGGKKEKRDVDVDLFALIAAMF